MRTHSAWSSALLLLLAVAVFGSAGCAAEGPVAIRNSTSYDLLFDVDSQGGLVFGVLRGTEVDLAGLESQMYPLADVMARVAAYSIEDGVLVENMVRARVDENTLVLPDGGRGRDAISKVSGRFVVMRVARERDGLRAVSIKPVDGGDEMLGPPILPSK